MSVQPYWMARPDTFAEVESGGEWQRARHLEYIADRILPSLMRGNARIIINMPPRHGKSELTSHWLPSWMIRLDPTHRTILTSYDGSLAFDFSRKVRDSVDPKTLRHDSAAISKWDTLDGGGLLAAGVRGGITGRGGNNLHCDDPHKNLDDALSELKNYTLHNWWDSTLMRRGEPGFNVLVPMTRWADGDLTGWLLKERSAENWDHIILPAIAEADDPMGRTVGEALWPERWPLGNPELSDGYLLHIKATTPALVWEGMYQQSPQVGSGNIWKSDWFKRWHHRTQPGSEYLHGWVPAVNDGEWIQSWDLSFKDSASSSFVVGQVWCKRGADCFLVHQVRERASFVRTIAMIEKMTHDYPQASLKLIEDKANGPAIMSQLQHKIGGMVPVEPYGSKVARALAVSPQIEGGNVYVPADNVQGAEWVKDFISECARFPNAANDDQVDTTSQALTRLQTSQPIFFGVL